MIRILRSFRVFRPRWSRATREVNGQVVRVEKVRIRKARPLTRNLGALTKLVAVAPIFLTTTFIAGSVLLDDDDVSPDGEEGRPEEGPRNSEGKHGDHSHGQEDDDEEDVEEVGVFIPFPFTITQLPSRHYTRRELEEMAKAFKEPGFHKKLQEETTRIVQNAIARNAFITLRMGKIVGVSKTWLEVNVPPAPPPKYEESGIWIGPHGIEWTTIPLDSTSVKMLQRVLYPRPAALATWAFIKASAQEAKDRLANFLGFSGHQQQSASNGQPDNRTFPPTIGFVGNRLPPGFPGRPHRTNQSSPQNMRQSASPISGSPPGRPSDGPVSTSEDQTSSDQPFGVPLPSLPERAKREALETFRKEWRPLLADPPPMSLSVRNTVRVETTRGWVTVVIQAWYNTKTRQLDMPSIHMHFASIALKLQ